MQDLHNSWVIRNQVKMCLYICALLKSGLIIVRADCRIRNKILSFVHACGSLHWRKNLDKETIFLHSSQLLKFYSTSPVAKNFIFSLNCRWRCEGITNWIFWSQRNTWLENGLTEIIHRVYFSVFLGVYRSPYSKLSFHDSGKLWKTTLKFRVHFLHCIMSALKSSFIKWFAWK